MRLLSLRSLSLKLTLAFLFVSLIGIVIALLVIQQRTRSEFDRFLFNQDRNELVTTLDQYYRSTGSWQGVEEAILPLLTPWQRDQEMPGGRAPDSELRPVRFRLPLTVVGADRVVVYGAPERLGATIPEQELRTGISLEVDGKVVGWLIIGPNVPDRKFRIPETAFLGRVNQAVIIGGAIAVLIAFLLSLTVARTLMRPINELTHATQIVAKGEFGYQVKVHSKDELGNLATSFNKMSADLDTSSRLRRQMTADIAHDLRTPVSVILGYSEALSDGKLVGSPEIFSVIYQEAAHLSRMIDDLRLISLADAKELTLNLHAISPAIILERAATAFKTHAQNKEIILTFEAGKNLPEIEVDPERMAQVLGNLISNALRYTPHGGWIKLSAQTEGQWVKIRVSDNGTGIAAEDLPLVFTRFYRGDKNRQPNGEAGLGLTIAKALVEAQGGSISVESEQNIGTTFTIKMPSKP